MFSETDLEAAVIDGVVPAATAAAFRAHVARRHAAPLVDEEHFRLLTGFNDIFVSIAAVLLLAALAWIGQSLPVGMADGPRPLAGAFVAAAAWGLAEYFTRHRRMALPSILLLLAFVGGVFEASASALLPMVDGAHDAAKPIASVLAAVAAAIAAGAAVLHWRRFHVPITMAAGAAALVGLAVALVSAGTSGASGPAYVVAALAGLGVFAFAMWWDMRDTKRETRRADIAFWLHLLAAPLIVHPAFALSGLLYGGGSIGNALLVVALYGAMGLVSLAIDRRALLVSSLAYVLYAMSLLFREAGAVSLSVALTALVIGSALLLLSAFWQSARRAVLTLVPEEMRSRLPPVAVPAIPRPA